MVNNPLSNSDLRSLITRNLGLLAQQNPQAVTQFFEGLGYGTDLGVDIDRPEQLLEILGSKSPRLERLLLSSENRQWQSISGVFQITDEQIKGQKGLFQTFDWHYLQSYIVVAVTLTGQDYKRSELAQFTRELNRLSDIPILVLFCHGVYVTLAVIHRRPNLKDSAKDVLEKITLIKDIDTRDPHRAQVDILAEFAVSSLQKSYQVRNFDDLHQAWLKVFDISILNKNFFAELSAWYFWAVEAVYFPGAEFGKEKNHQQISVIRLITRLIFIWFLKEKGIIDRELFQSESAGVLLKNFEENGSSSDYYRAILQNLFFATLNTERSAEKLGNRQFFDSISDLHRQDACSTNSDCGMGILPVQAPKVESVQTQKVESVQVPKVEYSQFFQYGDYFQDRDKWLTLVKEIPFLNGGLFECLDQGEHRLDGFWDDEANPLSVPNYLFFGQEQTLDLSEITGNKQLKKQKVRGIFAIFNNYKFTVDENTPVEQEVALDPELLGKVFENLLAEYNPETETTARKKTGSFYTPREIVDYMVDEALLAYLMSRLWSGNSSGLVKLGSNQVQLFGDDYTKGQLSLHESVKLSNYSGTEADLERDLRDLLAYNDRNPLVNFPGLRQQITRAIAEIRVLDPACGSGAFPMGILQKLVYVLDQVDPRNDYWLEEQKNAEIAPVLADIEQAKKISYEAAREEAIAKLRERLAEIAAKFERESENYPRKLFLIERCIFGVDIQAIAVQIAKLRFFIALMVEQEMTEHKPNRGIVPLPNLETKFVAANTLIGITRSQTLRRPEVFEKEKALKEVRQEHFLAQTPMRKQVCRARDAQLRSEILALLRGTRLDEALVDTLASWNPYDQNASARFFDAEWMFGMTEGFDVVIGNPPYVRQEKIKEFKAILQKQYKTYAGVADLFVYFFEQGVNLLKMGGILTYICSNKYFRSGYGQKLRQFLATETQLKQLIDFGDAEVFTAIAYPSIIVTQKAKKAQGDLLALNWDQSQDLQQFPRIFADQAFQLAQSELKSDGWRLESGSVLGLLEKLRKAGKPLGEYVNGKFYYGIKTGFNEAFVIDQATKDRLIVEHPSSAEVIKPFLRGRDVKRWSIDYQNLYLIFTKRGIDINKYPAILKHLSIYKERLKQRAGDSNWFELQASPAETERFEQPKIIYPDIATRCEFTFDRNNLFVDCTLFLIPVESPYLLGFLNSHIVQFFINQICPAIRGDFRRFKSIYVSQIPILNASPEQKQTIETLVTYILYLTEQLKENGKPNTLADQSITDKRMNHYFEEILDALVLELYLPEELHQYNKNFFQLIYAENLPPLESIKGDKIRTLRTIFQKLYDNDNPLRYHIFTLDTIPVVRIIQGKT